MCSNNRIEERRKFVKDYVDSQTSKGVKVSFSVKLIANKVLFISERQVYKDLAAAKSNKY